MNFPDLSDREFVEKFISVLDLGAKDSTYKFAFARFLLDYSREHSAILENGTLGASCSLE